MATPLQEASRRPDFSSYPIWMKGQLDVDLSLHESHYDVVRRDLAEAFGRSAFWTSVVAGLRVVDAQYEVDTKFPLISIVEPKLVTKSWGSFLHKTFRRNVLNNENFPQPPAGGWIEPSNWFSRITDIVRTTIEVKYLDGVPLILKLLSETAAKEDCRHNQELQGRVDGYYGAQFECQFTCSVPDLNWKRYDQQATAEVQVTTSMKEVLKKLLHAFYEESRTKAVPPSIEEIAWNYNGPQFKAAYLGHILHYVEGMIIEVRDQRKA